MSPNKSAWTEANLAAKRAAFPLRAPRCQTLFFWPVTVLCAAVDGYFEAFFKCFSYEDLDK